mmetsp:Transcript_7315/g.17661  ORF Transcript_7315/g.17661 Transcript_7315/m.17661 type:complete len:111 (-) Transcript_7315:97-429(-)|eukprot:CAMPEP_0178993850 /NCGR_PEP_ID=MMETSP0795-20121207/6942_1 /TAXON_ID=88552 /ORGANISM="Amoebophrya sp., Strain Ameob2" /LENGTH=110 /DNA_ID=CAMNT_0020685975 /DNA_START=358 /DNA_END=690 /DNA_ORIENTATION=+
MVLDYEILLPQLAMILTPFVVFAVWRWDSAAAWTDRRLLDAQQQEKAETGTLPTIESVESQTRLGEPLTVECYFAVAGVVAVYIGVCYLAVTYERQRREQKQLEAHQKRK